MEGDDILESMILDGSVQFAGVDSDTGEILYGFSQKVAELHPEIYAKAQNFFHSMMYKLWEQGFISMNIAEANPLIRLNEKSFDQDAISKLDPELQNALHYVIESLRKD